MEQSRYTGFSGIQSMRQDQNAARDSDLSFHFLLAFCYLCSSLRTVKQKKKISPTLTSMERTYSTLYTV